MDNGPLLAVEVRAAAATPTTSSCRPWLCSRSPGVAPACRCINVQHVHLQLSSAMAVGAALCWA